MDYKRQLASPLWQRKRLQIMERDDFECKLCGDKESELHVHHKSYGEWGKPWEVPDDQLICYCVFCHFVVEDVKKYFGEEVKVMLRGLNIGEFRKYFAVTKNNSAHLYALHINSSEINYVAGFNEEACQRLGGFYVKNITP